MASILSQPQCVKVDVTNEDKFPEQSFFSRFTQHPQTTDINIYFDTWVYWCVLDFVFILFFIWSRWFCCSCPLEKNWNWGSGNFECNRCMKPHWLKDSLHKGLVIHKGLLRDFILMSTGIILCMRPANERWHYKVTSSLTGWVHAQNDPCQWSVILSQNRLNTSLLTCLVPLI